MVEGAAEASFKEEKGILRRSNMPTESGENW